MFKTWTHCYCIFMILCHLSWCGCWLQFEYSLPPRVIISPSSAVKSMWPDVNKELSLYLQSSAQRVCAAVCQSNYISLKGISADCYSLWGLHVRSNFTFTEAFMDTPPKDNDSITPIKLMLFQQMPIMFCDKAHSDSTVNWQEQRARKVRREEVEAGPSDVPLRN